MVAREADPVRRIARTAVLVKGCRDLDSRIGLQRADWEDSVLTGSLEVPQALGQPKTVHQRGRRDCLEAILYPSFRSVAESSAGVTARRVLLAALSVMYQVVPACLEHC